MGSGASKKQKIILYSFPLSPPCRAVIMTAKAANIPLELRNIDLLKGEHKEPAFLKINPAHTVPTLVVEGTLTLWESRAIQQFLIDQYAPNHTLYPRDPVKRAKIDRMLQYDLGTLVKIVRDYMVPQIFANQPADPEKAVEVEKALDYLDEVLKESKYIAAPHLTIADFSVTVTLSLLELKLWDFTRWAEVKRWRQSIRQELAWYDEVNRAVEEFTKKLNTPTEA